jgi:hypothetical protein
VITTDNIVASFDDCPLCLGLLAPCTGEGDCDTLHVAYYDGTNPDPLCEVDLIKTGPCTWTNPDAETTDCGGANFVISSMAYDAGTSTWILQMGGKSGSDGFQFVNPGG